MEGKFYDNTDGKVKDSLTKVKTTRVPIKKQVPKVKKQ